MLRNRLVILASGLLLAASAAKADGVAYIDCSSHPEDTQVFGKPRRTPESVASVACGERFTVLLYGFIFSRIQTKDGQVGYIYSSLISADHSGASVQQPTAIRTPAASSKAAVTTATVAQPPSTAPAQVQATPAAGAQPTSAAAAQAPPTATVSAQPAPASVTAPRLLDAAAVAQVNSTPAVTPEPTVAPKASTQGVAATPRVSETAATVVSSTPTPTAPGQAQAAPTPAETTAAAVSVRETPAEVAQPEATPAAQPEPEPTRAQPAAPAIRAVSTKESWEKPNPGVRTLGVRNVGMPRLPLIELFGGYGFARLDNGAGSMTNVNGVLGSFGWNVKPWLQLIADSSYSRTTISGTKNVLYGNHWGVRYFRRLRHSWGAAPFVEGMIGGSRADVTVSGASGYSTSDIGLSYKVGGGLDFHPLRHFDIRVVDFDYYRTSFGTNLHQNNYFISTGIVMRLFGRSEE